MRFYIKHSNDVKLYKELEFFHELLSDCRHSFVLAHLLNNEKFFKIAIEAIRTKKTPHINEIIQRQYAKKFIFSNEFILPLIESTDDTFTLNATSVEYIFRRNDTKFLKSIDLLIYLSSYRAAE